MKGGFGSSGDMVLAKDRVLSSVKGPRGEHLVDLDLQTGEARDVGPLTDEKGVNVSDVYGLIFKKDVLYGLTVSGWIVKIDPATARCTRLLSTGVAWYGATDYERL
jgi:hypothetical protein